MQTCIIAQLMSLPLAVSCFSKIQIGCTFSGTGFSEDDIVARIQFQMINKTLFFDRSTEALSLAYLYHK